MTLLERVRVWFFQTIIATVGNLSSAGSVVEKISGIIFSYATTLFGIGLAFIILTLPKPFETGDVASDLFYVVAGIIGTMLALTFSLSAVPLQKAAESFGGMVSDIYRKDPFFRWIFVLLSGLCLFCAFCGLLLDYFQTPVTRWHLVTGIVSMAGSFDLIRLYNSRSTELLMPAEGIKRLSNLARRYFSKHHRRVKLHAKLNWLAMPESIRKDAQPLDLEKILYQTNARNEQALKFYTADLIEMAGRSIVSRQTDITRQALVEVASLASFYLQTRGKTFTVLPAGFLVSTSDANKALSPILESLNDLKVIAFEHKDQTSCIFIARCMESLIGAIMDVEKSISGQIPRPFTWHTLGYLQSLGEDVIKNGFSEAGLEVVRILSRLVHREYPDHFRPDFIRHAIDQYYKMTLAFYSMKLPALADIAASGIMETLLVTTKLQLRGRDSLHKDGLSKMNLLFLGALGTASAQPMSLIVPPMEQIYNPASEVSLYSFLRAELALCVEDKERPFSSPYHDFIETSEAVRGHFRHISEKYNVANNSMSFHLFETIGYIAKLLLHAIENPVRVGHDDEDGLERELLWHLAFLSNIFYKRKDIDLQWATKAATLAGYIGITAYRKGRMKVTEDCLQIVANITSAWRQSDGKKFDHLTDDFFETMWMFVYAAKLTGKTSLASKYKAVSDKALAEFLPEQQTIINERLEGFAERLESNLDEDHYYGAHDTPEQALRPIYNAAKVPNEKHA